MRDIERSKYRRNAVVGASERSVMSTAVVPEALLRGEP
jgi:hypothetical protein